MPKKPHSSAHTTALAVIDPKKPVDLEKLAPGQIRNSCEFDAAELGRRAQAMLSHIEALKVERAQKAVLAGLYLHQVKDALGHGTFREWTQEHFGNSCQNGIGVSQRSITNYMGLAAAFCRKSKLLLPEIVASQQLSLTLEAKGSDAQAFKAKLQKFVGERGLTELMALNGVIKQGGNQRPADAAKPAAQDQPPPDSLRPEAQIYNDFVEAVERAERVLLDDARWLEITPELGERVEPLLKRLLTQYHEKVLRAKHEAA